MIRDCLVAIKPGSSFKLLGTLIKCNLWSVICARTFDTRVMVCETEGELAFRHI